MVKNIFFARTEYLDILHKRISGLKHGYRQNLAIIGDEFIGKTSVLFNFLRSFYDAHIVIMYLELRPESFGSFARRFIGVLLYNFLANSGMPLREDLDYLIDKSQKYIPKTVEKIRLILSLADKKAKSGVFTELMSLCEILSKETGKFCVVIFDEFHNLESFKIRDVYREWSKLLILQKNTVHIITSSMKYKTRNILNKDLSLLFGNFELISIEPFDIKTSEKYIDHRLSDSQLDCTTRSFIVNFTGGYPFYLEIISDALLKNSSANIVDVLEGMLFSPSGILNQRFSNYLKRYLDLPQSNDYLAILYSICNGRNKLKEIAHSLRKTKDELSLRITQLMESDIIERSGDFLKFSDRVFSFWLKYVHQGKLASLTYDDKNQRTVFRASIERSFEEFLDQSRKPLPERMKDLFVLFEGETAQIEKKKLKLTHFREIKSLEFNRPSLKDGLLGRTMDSLWIIAFKYDRLTEDDVAEFVKECKRYRNKLERKVIVTLRDVDANARLRAMDEKILTWDLNSVNQILDLFSKPRVIV